LIRTSEKNYREISILTGKDPLFKYAKFKLL